jgi:hypothetical protein
MLKGFFAERRAAARRVAVEPPAPLDPVDAAPQA